LKYQIQTVLWLTVGLLCASNASAQADAAQRPPGLNIDLKIPALVWVAAVASDQATTYRFSSQYPNILHEENPFIHGLERHPVWLVAAGTAMDAATGWAAYRFLAPRHPRLVRMAFYGAAAYRVYLAAHNVRMMQQAQRLR
jgi:hypothetical protein